MQVIGYMNRSRQGGTGISRFDKLTERWSKNKAMPGKSLTGSTSPGAWKPP